MMRPAHSAAVLAVVLSALAACAHQVDHRGTLASLHQVQPDTKEVPVDQGLDRAVQSYRDFLQQAPKSHLAPEAMRRLADLNIEKQFGIHGDGPIVELPATPGTSPPASGAAMPGGTQTTPGAPPAKPPGSGTRAQAAALRAPAVTKINARASASHPGAAGSGAPLASERDLERRAASPEILASPNGVAALTLPGGVDAERERAGPLEAIKLYDELLEKYPQYAFRDQVLYQKARAYDELGQSEAALKVMEQLARESPRSRFTDEVQFRRAEHFFIARKYRDAESAYTTIVESGPGSEYYEPALYKLGWTLY
ncbi:MAG TPA: tetratricopeptide repeat protein, partial [Steroidobacteraceae bacterium]|nr:tetratricopeptide repeat protein [Steroidobacteraceae bacterium]